MCNGLSVVQKIHENDFDFLCEVWDIWSWIQEYLQLPYLTECLIEALELLES